jgi:hypothetical protein
MVPDADELLLEAQYAFQNVSHGATDSKKYAAKAKSFSRRILRKYPDSQEATAARSILEKLGERVSAIKVSEQHVLVQGDERHHRHRPEAQDVRRSADATNRDAVDVRIAGIKKQLLMPGWPLRLMQAIPVVVGVILFLRGLNALAYSRLDASNSLFLVSGAFLIYFPRLDAFGDLVSYAKTKIFQKEIWHAESRDLPTLQDFEEIIAAFVNGDKGKRLVMIVMVLLLSGLFITLSAVFYVVGARNALDSIEGWLLNRKSAVPKTGEPQ